MAGFSDDNTRTSSTCSSSAQLPPDDEFFQVDRCNMIQMDYTAFDEALTDPYYFTLDTCNMIHLDVTSKAEVPTDTVLYAAFAKIVDTVRVDHEHLGHIPLLQLKKMIQDNLISPNGSSEKAHLLSTYNQIKELYLEISSAPPVPLSKTHVVPQPLESTRNPTSMGDLSPLIYLVHMHKLDQLRMTWRIGITITQLNTLGYTISRLGMKEPLTI